MNPNELFKQLNQQFFNGELPDYKIEFVPVEELEPDDGDEGGEHIGAEKIIRLTEPLRDRPEALRRMLIHEMIHALTGDDHDEAFFDKMVEIARTGEDWAWDEAKEYHPCSLKTMIYVWRNYCHHPIMRLEGDPRTTCSCKACGGWRESGELSSESIEEWQPWAPDDAPPHIRGPLPCPW